MDIVLQFGEFTTDESFWKDFFSTAAAGAITVWLFFKNIDYNKGNEDAKKKQFEKDRLTYFTATLYQIVDLVKRQNEKIDLFTEELDKDPLAIPILGMFPLHDVERLANKIDHAEYYHAFANQNRLKEGAIQKFDTIYSSIDYFDSQLKKVYEHLKSATQKDYESKKLFQEKLSTATRECDELRLKLRGNSDKKEIVQALMDMTKIYLERMRADPSNLHIPNEQFFDPIINNINSYLAEPSFFSLFFKVSEAKNSYETILGANVKLASAFKEHRKEMADVLIKLQDQISILEDYRNPVPEQPVRKKWWSFLQPLWALIKDDEAVQK